MSAGMASEPGHPERIEAAQDRGASPERSDSGPIGGALRAIARLFPAPPAAAGPLLVAGVILGAAGDALLHGSGPVGINLSLWVALVAAAVLALSRRATLALDRERAAWLVLGVLFSTGPAWRAAPPLILLALGGAVLCFALAAYRPTACWVRSAGILQYGVAFVVGALHAWTAAALAVVDAVRAFSRPGRPRGERWRKAAAIARGLLIAVPLVAVFGALFISADAVFAELAAKIFRFDFEWIASHLVLFAILAWISTGYLRGFLTGTALTPLYSLWRDGAPVARAVKRPGLGITEAATALAALDLLFLAFVAVQFRYLFGGDALVRVTPNLTYAEYARRGFFELVFAVVLVVPVLLAADWILERRTRRDVLIFRSLSGALIGLVLAVAASAFERLRLYYASYGLTESRFYAAALLIWIGAMLLWLAATVLRGRREWFAFGMLASGLAAVVFLFAMNPDALIARVNVARLVSAGDQARFDVKYAMSLSSDATPVLIEALPSLPREAQCPLARSMLRRWPPDRSLSMRSWRWPAVRATDAVRRHEALLRSLVGPDGQCPATGPG